MSALERDDPRCKAMRAAVYCRKSTASEGRSKSREEQEERCLQDAERFGFGSVEVYMEEEGQKGEWWWLDEAGRNPAPHRPELSRLVRDIEAGKVQAVLVYKQDRLVRDNGVSDGLSKIFREHGIRYICQGRDTEIDTARGLYQVAVDSAAARQWRDQVSEEIKRDQHYKARNGMFSRNPSCYGFRSRGKDTQEAYPVWEEIAMVRRIFNMFVVGEDGKGPLGTAGIANRLMDEGTSLAVGAKNHKPKNPKKVHEGGIATILRNCMYVARWRHLGEEYRCDRLLVPNPVTGELETVVPLALFEEAQRKLAARPSRGGRSASSDHLLSGVAVCGKCGRPLQVNHRRRSDGSVRQTYFCPRTRDTIPCDREGTVNLMEPQIDEWALEHLAPWLAFELAAQTLAFSGSVEQDRMAEVQRRLDIAKKRETDDLAAALGVLDTHQLSSLASKLRMERESLERQLGELRHASEARQRQLPAMTEEEITSLDPKAQKALLRSALQWIAVTDKGVVALTSWGSYVGGRIVPRTPSGWNAPGESRRKILPPDPASCLECPSWLSAPALFMAGRRQWLGPRGEHLANEEILPDLFEPRGGGI